MTTRIPLAVAVVGVLLAGGATTGTTRASWTDPAVLPTTAVGSGRMGFAVAPPTAMPALSQDASSSGTSTLTVTDTSAGKNLTQRITATVTGQPPGVTATVGTSCGTATQASVSVDRHPGGTATLCVKVVASATAVSGDVTVGVSGAQLPSGWSTPPRTVTVPVTVTRAASFALSCYPSALSKNNQYRIAWAAVPGAGGYVIQQSTDATGGTAAGPFTQVATGSGLSYTGLDFQGQETRWFRVVADNGEVSSLLRVTRDGDGFTCGPAT